MLGAIAGDIIGSVYETKSRRVKTEDFELFPPGARFTDDTVMTIAVARAILDKTDYAENFKEYGQRYPDAGYGPWFKRWLTGPGFQPYNSFGNGSAMRVSPVGFSFDREEDVWREATRSAVVTHDHPEGIKGARAVAMAVWMLRQGQPREKVKTWIETRLEYDLSQPLEKIRLDYKFDSSCQGSVPEALTAFFESRDFEDAIRKAVSLGGDSDTQACIAGALAEAAYGAVPSEIGYSVRLLLPADLLLVVEEWYGRFPSARSEKSW